MSPPELLPPPAAPVVDAGAPALAPASPALAHSDEAAEHAALAIALRRRTPLWKPVSIFTLLVLAGAGVVALGAIPKVERDREAPRRPCASPPPPSASSSRPSRSRRRRARSLSPPPSRPTCTRTCTPRPRATCPSVRRTSATASTRATCSPRSTSPLVEQDLRRAQAAQTEAEANREKVLKNLELARTTLERWQSVQGNAVARQEIDERQAAYDALVAGVASAEAAIESRRADVQRLQREKSFGGWWRPSTA